MKKKILPIGLSFILLLCAVANVTAQSDEEQAKIKFLQAEKSYRAGNYKESLAQLQEAEKLLGRKTPRVQFLKVLACEKLALTDMAYLEPALSEMNAYIAMQNAAPESHRKNISWTKSRVASLPADAKAKEDYRIEQARLAAIRAWKAESIKLRMGIYGGFGGRNWIGVDYGLMLGTRSGFFIIGSSTLAGKEIMLDDQFHSEVAEQLRTQPYGTAVTKSLFHIGYLQGIRVMPRENDMLKPMIGARLIYAGEYTKAFMTESGKPADEATVTSMVKAGVDPANYFKTSTRFKGNVAVEAVVGAMLHLRKATFFAGMDVLKSNTIQVGAAIKVR